MKPQIGGPILLWSLARGQRWRGLLGIGVAAGLTLLFASRIGINPVTLVVEYVSALVRAQGTPAMNPGHTDLRSWLLPLAPSPAAALAATFGLMPILLSPLLIGLRRFRGSLPGDDFEVAAFCGVVSLLAVRHLSYDLLLLLPLLVAWRVPPFSSRPQAAWKHVAFWSVAALLVAEIPSLWRRFLAPAGAPAAFGFVTELDRWLCLGVWVVLTWRFVVLGPTLSRSNDGEPDSQ
jgi:hypothetical protein